MGNQSRNSQPITSHPLFPAVVALWFGALFGLGSLALRASLLESFVLSSNIDAIVPQAAPPLGITARILVASALAIVGGVLGGRIGRWIARPKAEVRERRRAARPAARDAGPARANRRPAVAAAAPQVAANPARDDPSDSAPASRRRSLAIEEGPVDAHRYHEAAPLPGGQPQILDVTEFDLTRADAGPEPMGGGSSELDLGDFPSQDAPIAPEPPVAAPAALETTTSPYSPEVVDPAVDPAKATEANFSQPQPQEVEQPHMIEFRNSVLRASVLAPEEAPAFDSAPVSIAGPFDAGLAGNATAERAFAAPLPEPPVPAPARPFAAPAASGAEPPVAAQATAVDAPGPGNLPLAARPFAAPAQFDGEAGRDAMHELPAEVPAWEDTSFPSPVAQAFEPLADSVQPPAALPRFAAAAEPAVVHDEPAYAQEIAASEPCQVPSPADFADGSLPPPVEPLPYPAPDSVPFASAIAPRIATASLAELSPVELVERMALSLQRRRALAPAPAASSQTPSSSSALAVALAASEGAEPGQPEEAPVQLTLPAAMRPIDFSEFEDPDENPGLVPARSILLPPRTQAPAEIAATEPAMPAEPQLAAAPFAAPPMPPAALDAAPAEAIAEFESDEEAVLEDGYSSLLDLSRPVAQRQQFVRIEEPEAEVGAIEPVVIFPGRAVRAETRFDAPAPAQAVRDAGPAAPAGPSAADQPALHRLDLPAEPKGQAGGPPLDPSETERALRSALATLQRMTGAA